MNDDIDLTDPTTSVLSVLVPNAITTIESSTAPETDYAVWAAATTYGVGTNVISTVTHTIYQSLRASNTGNDPTLVVNQSGSTPWWLVVGPTNRWAMFDNQSNTQTTIASPLTVVLQPGGYNGLFLSGMLGDTLTVTCKTGPGGTVVFTETFTLESSAPPDYNEYFFSPFKQQATILIPNIPQYMSGETTITIANNSGTGSVSCGACIFGDLRPLGETQYQAKITPRTFSYINTDDFGNTTIVTRNSATDMTATALLDTDTSSFVVSTIQQLLSVPCVWIGSNLSDFVALQVYGLGSADISYDYFDKATLELTVTGMI